MRKNRLLFPVLLVGMFAITSCFSKPQTREIEDYVVIETPSKRMPAEFEPVSTVKLCYPEMMPLSAYKLIADHNKVLVLVNPNSRDNSRIEEATSRFTAANINMENVTFLDMNLDGDREYWIRDFSPFYVFDELNLSAVDFTYNRPLRVNQNNVPSRLAEYLDIPYSKMDLVHTGGNLMQDGRGTAFSDDLVISENSNNEEKVREQMKEYTGTDNYVITIDPQGDYIAHIDCWGKIIAPDKIVVARLPRSHERYSYYEEVARVLENTTCAYGYNYKVYRIDEPGNQVAPYTNSLITNNYVYMPLGENAQYNQRAIETYNEALPGYTIIGVEGYNFDDYYCFLNTDALHCRTHEIPDKDMLFIDSREVLNGAVQLKDNYLVKANVVSYAKKDIKEVKLHYSINNKGYITVDMDKYEDTTNYTYYFENLKSGDDVKYYITAVDKGSHSSVDPTCGELDPHHFVIE